MIYYRSRAGCAVFRNTEFYFKLFYRKNIRINKLYRIVFCRDFGVRIGISKTPDCYVLRAKRKNVKND